jgi:hypothetical protein
LEKLAALQRMHAENLNHYDVFCPRCRKANSVSRQRLEIFTPGWQEGLRTLEAEAAQMEKVRTEPVITSMVVKSTLPPPAEKTRNRHVSAEKKPAVEKPADKKAAKPAAAVKKVAKAKPAAKKTAAKAKPAAKKPVAKPKPAAKKPAAKPKPAAKKAAKPAVKKTVKKKK